MSKFDRLYRRLILTGFFSKGWGDPGNLKRILEFRKVISNREACQHLVPHDYPIHIEKEVLDEKDCIRKTGYFKSPFSVHLPGVMPKEVETARFEIILPKTWKTEHRPVCLHLAGTGDHYFGRRRMLMARPLIKESGIASILLENPFYGSRKPKQQTRSSLQNVSDLFVMGGALVLESMALFHWCERQGYGPLGITGISMGGHMASAAATNWHKPLSMVPCLSACTASYIFTEMASLAASNWQKAISLVPCLSWSTASSVFLNGVLSGSIHWKELNRQFESDSVYREDLIHLIHSPEFDVKQKINGKSFSLGKEFAKQFSGNVDEMMAFHEKQMTKSEAGHENEPNNNCDIVKNANVNVEGDSDSGNISKSQTKIQVDDKTQSHTVSHDEKMAADSTQSKSKNEQGRDWYLLNGKYIRESLKAIPIRLHLLDKSSARHKVIDQSTVDFMRGIMDECTHLGNFSVPIDTELIIIVLAKHDAYVPTANVQSLQRIWPGADVRLVNAGHINAYLLNHGAFRKAIADSFDRQINKYYTTPPKETTAKFTA